LIRSFWPELFGSTTNCAPLVGFGRIVPGAFADAAELALLPQPAAHNDALNPSATAHRARCREARVKARSRAVDRFMAEVSFMGVGVGEADAIERPPEGPARRCGSLAGVVKE
jgi:hypothetical protein